VNKASASVKSRHAGDFNEYEQTKAGQPNRFGFPTTSVVIMCPGGTNGRMSMSLADQQSYTPTPHSLGVLHRDRLDRLRRCFRRADGWTRR